jgi:hypothetical protein
MAKRQHVIELPAQGPRSTRDGEPVLDIKLPREVTSPEEFGDVELIPGGEREIVPSGLAPLSEVLHTGVFGLVSRLGSRKRDRSPRPDGNGAAAPLG